MKLDKAIEVVLAACLVLFVLQLVGYSFGAYSLEALVYVLSLAFAVYAAYFLWKLSGLERTPPKRS
ncbi:MAG: hypothetical protein ACP5O3_00120 [Candidatus Micrarchaeia archaeon]